MDYELIMPWIIVGGYVLAGILFYLAAKASDRGKSHPDGAGRPLATLTFSAATLALSATTFYWLSQAFDPLGLTVASIGFAALVFGAIYWRKRGQAKWMTELATRTGGTVHRPDDWQQPSFGVLPNGDHTVAAGTARGGYEHAIEVPYYGQRLLGIDFILGTTAQPPDQAEVQPSGSLAKSTRLVNNFHLVQLPTPPVPTLVLRPSSNTERLSPVGHSDPHHLGVAPEMKIARNLTGVLTPDPQRHDYRTGNATFDVLFSVQTADRQFAQTLLTPQFVDALTQHQPFRFGQLTFQHGVIWTSRYGKLTEQALFEAATSLMHVARLVPAQAWQYAHAGQNPAAGQHAGQNPVRPAAPLGPNTDGRFPDPTAQPHAAPPHGRSAGQHHPSGPSQHGAMPPHSGYASPRSGLAPPNA